MPLDLYGIEEYHEDIRRRIGENEPGLVQSVVGDVLVSWDRNSFWKGPTYSRDPYGRPDPAAILDEMIVDVARGEGIASDRTFNRSRIVWMVEDREAYPDEPRWAKKRNEALLLRAFYLDGGEGARHLKD